jgi:hypothetical protein
MAKASPNCYLKDGKRIPGRWIYNRPRGGMDKFTAQIRYGQLTPPYLHSKVFYTLEEAVAWVEDQPDNLTLNENVTGEGIPKELPYFRRGYPRSDVAQ